MEHFFACNVRCSLATGTGLALALYTLTVKLFHEILHVLPNILRPGKASSSEEAFYRLFI